MVAPDKVILKFEPQRPGSKILCIALCVWECIDAEARIKVVRGRDGKPITRWPREMIDDNQVFQFRMRTAKSTEVVDRAIMAECANAGIY